MLKKVSDSILCCCCINLLILAMFAGCSYIKYIKFSKNNKSVKIYIKQLCSNELTLYMKGSYVFYGPKLDMGLKITLKYKPHIEEIRFKPENISISFKDRILKMKSPPIDSTILEAKGNNYILYTYFNTGRFDILNKDEIKYLREAKFPLKISLDNFIFVNDTAIVIDTIFATSPKL